MSLKTALEGLNRESLGYSICLSINGAQTWQEYAKGEAEESPRASLPLIPLQGPQGKPTQALDTSPWPQHAAGRNLRKHPGIAAAAESLFAEGYLRCV